MAKQIGPPVTIEKWLVRAVDDPTQPRVLSEAVLFENGSAQYRLYTTAEGFYVFSRDDMEPPFIPNAVLSAVLNIGGWKISPHVMKEI